MDRTAIREARRKAILEVIDSSGVRVYSRGIAEVLAPSHIRNTVPWVQKELRWLERHGVLQSELVAPGPDTFKGGMQRRYYWRADGEG